MNSLRPTALAAASLLLGTPLLAQLDPNDEPLALGPHRWTLGQAGERRHVGGRVRIGNRATECAAMAHGRVADFTGKSSQRRNGLADFR